jgi:hypothetical protein
MIVPIVSSERHANSSAAKREMGQMRSMVEGPVKDADVLNSRDREG